MSAREKLCDCPWCPCNVPFVGSKRDCLDCLAGNHMNRLGVRVASSTQGGEAASTSEANAATSAGGGMTTERKCKHVEGDGETHWYCGRELVPDETGPCVDCGNSLRMSAVQEEVMVRHHPYSPSRWLCPVHGEQ